MDPKWSEIDPKWLKMDQKCTKIGPKMDKNGHEFDQKIDPIVYQNWLRTNSSTPKMLLSILLLIQFLK